MQIRGRKDMEKDEILKHKITIETNKCCCIRFVVKFFSNCLNSNLIIFKKCFFFFNEFSLSKKKTFFSQKSFFYDLFYTHFNMY